MRAWLAIGMAAALAIGCSDDTTTTTKKDFKARPIDKNATVADSTPVVPSDLGTADKGKPKVNVGQKVNLAQADSKPSVDAAQIDAPPAADQGGPAADQPAVVGGLVINEVDYDQAASDTAEFLEIYNGSGADVALADLAVVFVNGNTSTQYGKVSLASAGSTLKAGQYLVIAASTVTVPSSALKITFSAADNNIQNGGDAGLAPKDGGVVYAADGVALVNTATMTVVDALSYEGSITAAQITGWSGTTNFVEGTVLDPMVADSNLVPGSLARLPNGQDTNSANADWKFTGTPTPGAANVP